jgi:micrococcal nuclease
MENLPVKMPDYVRYAIVERIVDGDTIDCTVELGWHTSVSARFRFVELNTAEIRGAEREEGLADMAYVQDWISVGEKIIIESHKDPKGGFGRWAARIWVYNHVDDEWFDFNFHLVNMGIAEESKY